MNRPYDRRPTKEGQRDMAELLTAQGLPEPGSLGAILSEGLPDSYFVVENPTVQGCVLDAVVFGPQGLFVLHLRDWAGEIEPSRHGDWWARLASGERVNCPDPTRGVQQADAAMRAFFRDEFPGLEPAIRPLLVLTDPDAVIAGVIMPELPRRRLPACHGPSSPRQRRP